MDTIYGFSPAEAGTIYTRLLRYHVQRDMEKLKEAMQELAQEIYGLDPDTAEKMAEAEINAFLAHNAAEKEDTPEKERDQSWNNAEEWLKRYYLVLMKRFRPFGILISPAELAQIDIAWWQDHNRKDYGKVQTGLTLRYAKLYDLTEEAAGLIARAEINAIKTYDEVKKGGDDVAWIKVERANIEVFKILKRELRNVYKTK